MRRIFNKKTIIIGVFSLLFLGGGIWFYIGDKKNNGERNFIPLLKDKLTKAQQEPVNLIICWTPLQMVVAERIIDLHPKEKFYTIVMNSSSKNDRFEYYSSRLAQKSERFSSFYIYPQAENKYFVYTTLLELKLKSLLFPDVKSIFLANVEKLENHTIISSFPNAQIKTFDDGTVNLIKSSGLLSDTEYVSGIINKKIYKTFINSTHSPKEVREGSVEHYTIFKDFPNVMNKKGRKMTYLSLFNASQLKESSQIKDTIKIMLGTVEKDLKETSEKAVEHFKIRYTTLHPRQTYKLDNAITLKSKLIIEDYLLGEIKKNPDTQYEIYTFFSGAALTLREFPNVKVYAIKPTSFPEDYWLNPIYDLYEQAKIPILEFDDK